MDLAHASQHTISMQSNDTHLVTKRIKIYVHPCDVGYGLSSTQTRAQKECVLCEMNHFNMDPNDNECHSCLSSADFNRIGYECRGANDIIIEHNWWISMAQYSRGWQYIFDDNHTAYDIISSICPPLFCCQYQDGCYYTAAAAAADDNSLCAKNRDASVALCGSCAQGYSEVYGSTECKICDDHYIYLFIVLLFGFIYAIAISFVIQYNGDTDDKDSDSFKTILKEIEEFNYTKLMMHDYVVALLISLFRPIAYFYQSMAYLLMNYSIVSMHWVLPSLQIFAMDLSISISGFCFVSGLTALSEEIWLFFIPFSLFLSIAIIWVILQYGASSYLLKRHSIHYSPNILGMAWSVWLLSMSTIMCRLFKIIACTSMGELSWIHFYDPQHECFDAIWYLAVIAIIMILLFWALLWYKLYQMGHKNRQKASTLHHQSIISPYKDEHWYWEFLVESRRVLIAALVTFQYINADYVNLILGAVLLVYLMLHFKAQPFKHKRINNMESLCLLMLICCFAVMNFAEKEGFIVILISIGLLAPFMLFMTRIYCCIKLFCSIKYGDGGLDINTQQKLFKAINRLHESKRDLICAIMHRTMPHIVIPTKNEDIDDNMIITRGASEDNDGDDDDDDDGEQHAHMLDEDLTSGNTSNNIMYFEHLNSPGAVPQFKRQITPASALIGAHQQQQLQPKGEESESFTPLTSRTVSNPQMVPAAYTSSITYLEDSKTKQNINILDYHQFIHKIETTKDYSSTGTTMYAYDESRSTLQQNHVIIDDVEQKYQYYSVVDGPAPRKKSSNKSDIDLALQMIATGYITDNNSNKNNEDIDARIQSALTQINNDQSTGTT